MSTSDNNITTINRSKDVARRERFMVPRDVKVFTQTSFSNMNPGTVGLSIYIEAVNDGQLFTVGKTKSVQSEKLPRIRESLDLFGKEFTKSAMQNTNESSFKSILSGILDNVLATDGKEQEED